MRDGRVGVVEQTGQPTHRLGAGTGLRDGLDRGDPHGRVLVVEGLQEREPRLLGVAGECAERQDGLLADARLVVVEQPGEGLDRRRAGQRQGRDDRRPVVRVGRGDRLAQRLDRRRAGDPGQGLRERAGGGRRRSPRSAARPASGRPPSPPARAGSAPRARRREEPGSSSASASTATASSVRPGRPERASAASSRVIPSASLRAAVRAGARSGGSGFDPGERGGGGPSDVRRRRPSGTPPGPGRRSRSAPSPPIRMRASAAATRTAAFLVFQGEVRAGTASFAPAPNRPRACAADWRTAGDVVAQAIGQGADGVEPDLVERGRGPGPECRRRRPGEGEERAGIEGADAGPRCPRDVDDLEAGRPFGRLQGGRQRRAPPRGRAGRGPARRPGRTSRRCVLAEARGERGDRGLRRRAHLPERAGGLVPERGVGVVQLRDDRREGLRDLGAPQLAERLNGLLADVLLRRRRSTRSGPAAPASPLPGRSATTPGRHAAAVLLLAWGSWSKSTSASKTSRRLLAERSASAPGRPGAGKPGWSSLSISLRAGSTRRRRRRRP